MSRVTPPNFQPARLVYASQLNAVIEAIPTLLTDLVTSPTGLNQVLMVTSLDSAGNYVFTWVPQSSDSPKFNGPVTLGADSTNHLVTHGATTNRQPIVQTSGSDPDIGMTLQVSGNGSLTVQSNTSIGNLSITPVAPNNTGGNIVLQATGAGAAVGIQLVPKGTAFVSVATSPPVSDNSTALATTEFVNEFFGAHGTSGVASVTAGNGSFTPAFVDSFVTGTGTGFYWTVGKVLFFSLSIPVATVSTASGLVTITGLPIPPAAALAQMPVGLFTRATGLSVATQLQASLVGATISLHAVVYGTSITQSDYQLTSGNLTVGTTFYVSGSYPID